MSVHVEIRQCEVCGHRVLLWNPSSIEQSAALCPDDNREMEWVESGWVELSDIKEHEGRINSLEHLRSD